MFGMMMLIVLVALRRAHNLMRCDVAKCWISEQEGVRAHARIVFVDKLFIPNVRAFKEFVGRVNTLLHFAVTV